MKICPNCRLTAPLNATSCVGCGHAYRTQFTAQQTQQMPSQVPPAPQAPTPPKWWQFFIPGVQQKYEADLLKHRAEVANYMEQNGLITPELKKRVTLFATIIGVMLVVFIAWTIVDSVRFNQKLDQQIERDFRESNPASAEVERQNRELIEEHERSVR